MSNNKVFSVNQKFSPEFLKVSGQLALWYDASDLSTISHTIGNLVEEWRDKSGNGFHLSPPATINRPLTNTNTVDGKNAIYFDGATPNVLKSDFVYNGFRNRFLMFAVMDTSSNASMIDMVNETDGVPRVSFQTNSVTFDTARTTTPSRSISNIQPQSNAIITANLNNSTHYMSVSINGNFHDGGTVGESGMIEGEFFDSVYIGDDSTGGNALTGNVCEMLLVAYDETETVSVFEFRDRIEGYLAQKWGLTENLSFDHPYKTNNIYKDNVSNARTNDRTWQPNTQNEESSLIGWYDASDSSTIITTDEGSGPRISTWLDKSTYRHHMVQNTYANMPEVIEKYINGRDVIDYDSSRTTYFVADLEQPVEPYIASENLMCVALLDVDIDDGAGTCIFDIINNSSGNQPRLVHNLKTILINATTFSGQSYRYTLSPDDISKTIITTLYNNDEHRITVYVNGEFIVSTTESTNGTPWQSFADGQLFRELYIGDDSTGFNASTGHACEYLFFKNPTNHCRECAEGYLAHKWGVFSNLIDTHPYRHTIPSQNQSWTPNTKESLRLWLDSGDMSTMTFSGNKLTQWIDKSNDKHVFVSPYAGVTLEPTYSKQSVHTGFGASQEALFTPSRLGFTANPDLIVVALVNVQDIVNEGINLADGIWCLGDPATPSSQTIYGAQSFSGWSWRHNGGSKVFNPVIEGEYALVSWQRGTGPVSDQRFFYNGTEMSPTSSSSPTLIPTNTDDGFLVGAGLLTAGGLRDGDFLMKEIVVLDSNNDLERIDIEGYMAHKWGYANLLPQSHPYKLDRPFESSKVLTTTQKEWVPSDLSSKLEIWLDASDESTLVRESTDNARVDQWLDKRGNGIVADSMGVLSTQPLVGYRFINGMQSITNRTITNKGDSSLVFNTNPTIKTVFAVLKTDGQDNHELVVPFKGVDGSEVFVRATSLEVSMDGTNGATGKYSVDGQELSSLSLADHSNTYFNSGNYVTRFVLDVPDEAYSVVGRIGLGNTLIAPSSIGEIVMFNDVLTDEEAQQVEGYLAHKWGLESKLPTEHPFRFSSSERNVLWTPKDLEYGPEAWYDAFDTTNERDNNDQIDTWFDKSGNERHMTTSSGAPDYSIENRTVTCSVNERLFSAGFFLGYGTSIYAVFEPEAITGEIQMIAANNSASSLQFLRYENGFQMFAGEYLTHGSGEVLQIDEIYIVGGRFNGSESSLVVNGDETVGDAGANLAKAGLIIGANSYLTFDSRLRYKELIACDNVLTDDDARKMEGYLAWKWDEVGKLPLTHPYKTTPPMKTAKIGERNWKPDKSPLMRAWYDAADLSSLEIDENNKVISWRQSHDGSWPLTAIYNEPPSYDYSTKTVSFNGVDEALYVRTRFGFGANPNIMFAMVCNIKSVDQTDERIMGIGAPIYNEGGNTTDVMHVGSGTGGWSWRHNGGSNVFGNSIIDEDVIVVFSMDKDSGYSESSFLRLNGAAVAKSAGSGSNPTNVEETFFLSNGRISGTFNRFLHMEIKEFVIMESTQREDELTVEGYLAHKWGMVNGLPDDHKYKTIQPTYTI